MTKTFHQSFVDVFRQSKADIKPLGAKLGKLFEEGGELAECVNIHQGYITHKQMKEPLVGEVADVVQCALAILVDAHPDMAPGELMEMFLSHFERKNAKWAAVQEGDAKRATSGHLPVAAAVPEKFTDGPTDGIHHRVLACLAEMLDVRFHDLDGRFVEEYGADSLDMVEMTMAIEDDFEMEIPDEDAERITTPRQAIAYVRRRIHPDADDQDVLSEDDIETFQASSDAVEAEAALQRTDRAADYTERTGRHLSLSERMNERNIL